MPNKKEVTPFVFLSERTETANINKMPLKKTTSIKALEYEESNKSKIVPFSPTDFNSVFEIAQELVKGSTVFINVASMNEPDAKRTLDFICGVVYAYKGRINQVNNFDFEASIFSD